MADKEINVNVKGADEIIAATKQAEAERIRLAAQQAMAASGTSGLGGLGGNSFTEGQYKRYTDAYQRAKAGAANMDAVDRLRNMQNMSRQAFPAVANGSASWINSRPPAADYVRRASKKFADIIREGGGAAGGVGADVLGSGGGGPFNPPTSSDGVAWYKQPGLGTTKTNGGASAGYGGGFNKSGLKGPILDISSAKARGVANVFKSLRSGAMPAVLRSSLVLWGAQEASNMLAEYTKGALKDVRSSASADEHRDAFVKHAHIGVNDFLHASGTAASGILQLGGMALAMMPNLLGKALGLDITVGGVLKQVNTWNDEMERAYDGFTKHDLEVRSYRGKQAHDFAMGVLAQSRADKYVDDFSLRNADELAALGFGSGTTQEALLDPARARIKANATRALVPFTKESDLDFDPSDGDD